MMPGSLSARLAYSFTHSFFQLQGLKETLLSQSHVARLLADGAQGKGGKIHTYVAVVLLCVVVDGVRQLHPLLTVHIFEHIDGLVAAGTVIGLLILGELCGVFHLLHRFKVVIRLTRTIASIGFVGKLLKFWRQCFFCPNIG